MEKQLRVLADVLSGRPLDLACNKLWEPHGWCEKHCSENQLEPDAECWLKYAEEGSEGGEETVRYGMPFKGSKNSIAEKVIDVLPEGSILYDLFGGGVL